MDGAHHWCPRTRKYHAEKNPLQRTEASSHPLKGITVTVTETKVKNKVGGKSSRSSSVSSHSSIGATPLDPLSSCLDGCDPLSMFAAEVDPLSQMVQRTEQMSITQSQKSSPQTFDDFDDTFEPWTSKRSFILNRYTTSEKLSITTSFLSAGDKVVMKATTSTVTDKVKNRLEQLDDFEEGSIQEMLNLSQQDYIHRIEELNNALIAAWDQDQRVKALKIAIQCAKLLADVSVIQFYPSKFVLVTDILDTFGRLVYDRIKNKATFYPKGSSLSVPLPENFTPDQVPESAKETCKNWFFKIASIRELIPRLYVEVAILKCYSFLTHGEYNNALRRLCMMIRGIGDPLVSVYARCYLCRVGVLVASSNRDHLMPCFDDFLFTYTQIHGDSVQNILAVQKLELPHYLTLYSPALDWILQCVAHKAEDSTLEQVLEWSKSKCNSALLLNSILSAFQPDYISQRAAEFTDMIRSCEETGFPKYLLYKSLGACVVLADPPEKVRLNLLNDVWKVIMKLKTPSDYITSAEVWIEYVAKNFSKRELNTVLGDIIKHMSPDRAYEDHYPQLQSIVTKILVHITDFSVLLSLEKFQPLLDMFQRESVRVDVCRNIMEAYCKNQTTPTNDPVIINALTFISKTMHDSVNALSLDDDIRSIAQLINRYIRTISFGRDFEQQLSYYVECRAIFSNIDQILVFLVQCVNQLAMQTRSIVHGNHNRKTAAFVRACAAYTFITIPSLNSIFSRLNLYLVSGQVALLNQCLSQSDAFFKAAISMIHEVPRILQMDGKMRPTEPLLLEYIQHLCAALLLIPDNPEQGVVYLVRGLLNVVRDYSWDSHNDTLSHIYLSVITLLSAMGQDTYLHNADKVDSNDVMYGSDPKFLGELNSLCDTLIDEILAHLTLLNEPATYKRQSQLSLEMFCRVLSHANLSDPGMFTLASNFWTLSQKHGQTDHKFAIRTLDYVKKKGKKPGGQMYSELASRMHLQTRT